MKIEIDVREIIPIKDFDLRWRWEKSNSPTISTSEIEQIQPVSEAESKRLNKVINYFRLEYNLRDKYTQTGWIRASSSNDADIEQFRNKLTSILEPWNEGVIVTWNRATTLKTTKAIFIKYWDDFCYPSSDDVTIISEETKWIMFYQHFEVANIWMKTNDCIPVPTRN